VSWCVYAVASADRRLAVRGAEGERLATVRAGRLRAIVGRVSARRRPTAARLRRYDAVMRRLWTSQPSLLPARFGTSFDSLEDLVAALRPREPALRRDLRQVRGRAQMTVRVLAVPRDDRSPRTPSPATPRGATSGTRYLKARAAIAAAEQEIAGWAPVAGAVKQWIRAERVERRGSVASVYHLVPRGAVDAYRRRLEAAAAAAGLRLVVTGPHPPYAFA
jgi:hypothetical protein